MTMEKRGREKKMPMRNFLYLAIAAILVQVAAGHLSPDGSGDAWAYALAGHLGVPAFLAFPRTPFYGWFLDVAGWHGAVIIPAIQILFFIAATGCLVRELNCQHMSLASQSAVAIACLFSTAFLLDSNRLLPELNAVSAGIAALAGSLAAARGRFLGFIAILFGTGTAYLLRPIFLPMIFAIPISVSYFAQNSRKLRYAALGLAFAALPFLAYSSLRAAVVGDFNVVSYGGYQASPMAPLLLDDKIVSRLDPDNRTLATSILGGIAHGEKAGSILAVPVEINSKRSFNTTAVFYPDAIAAAYDQVSFVISKQKKPGEGYVEFNRRLMLFDIAIIKLAPGRMLLWTIGQTARLVGQAVMTNISMGLAVFLVFMALGLRRKGDPGDADIEALLIINLVWLISAGLLAVCASFAATRYINTAGIFMPALPAYWALRRFNLDGIARYLGTVARPHAWRRRGHDEELSSPN